MKKFGFFLFTALGLIACGDDNSDPTPEQHVTCSISAPAEGAMINIAEKMTTKGETTIDFGEISNVTLKIGGKAISEATVVPFSYDYTLEADQTEGALKIELIVKGDQGTMVTSEVNITLTKLKPTPEPGEGEMVDSHNNHVYKTVEIGEQTWMAENLTYLPGVNKPAVAATCGGESLYFVYDYDGENVNAVKNTEIYKTHGVLHNWYATVNKESEEGKDADAVPSGVQGIYSSGWHPPSKAKWKVLENLAAEQLPPVEGDVWGDDFGDKHSDSSCKNVWSVLAGPERWSASGNSDMNPDLVNEPRNTYGPTIIPSGQCYQTGDSGWSESGADFWTIEMQSQGAGNITFSNNSYGVTYSKYGITPRRGFPIRCIED